MPPYPGEDIDINGFIYDLGVPVEQRRKELLEARDRVNREMRKIYNLRELIEYLVQREEEECDGYLGHIG